MCIRDRVPVCGYVLNGVQEGTTGYGYSSYGGYGYGKYGYGYGKYGYCLLYTSRCV